jgi:hypothetical protein
MWLPNPVAPIHWQWQIGTDFNINTHVVPHVTVYDIDGFSTSAATVTALHALGCKVIAYFSFGTYENWRPDAAQFTAAIKGNTNGWPGENWLDIRAALVKTIMTARIALAASKGFDAIEPDNIDGYSNSTGFPLTAQDQLNFNQWIASTVHSYGMSVGLKNDVEQAASLQPYFDWALNEECYKYSECSSLVSFINANKAVFQVEYSGTGQCSSLNTAHFNSMTRDIDLTAPTDSTYKRTPCIPDTQDTWSGASGFVHGTTHSSAFQVTVTPANQSCQIELWLGVGTSATYPGAATSGKTAFTSTGSAQNMNLLITLPAAGSYYAYIDLYMGSVKFASFIGNNPITVT